MDSAGMMKMATGDGFPLRQGAGTGSREVFGGYRGLRWQNSRSIVLPDVFSLYGDIYAKEIRQGGHEGPMRVEGAPRWVGVPPASWLPRRSPDVHSKSSGLLLKFQVNWTPFGFPFLRYSKTR